MFWMAFGGTGLSQDRNPATLEVLAKQLNATGAPSVAHALEALARQSDDLETSGLAIFSLGYSAFQKQDWSSAAKYFDDPRLKNLPIRDHATILLARAQRQTRDYSFSLATLDQFQMRFPNSILLADALEIQCQDLMDMGAPERCVKLLDGQPPTENFSTGSLPRMLFLGVQALEAAGNWRETAKRLNRIAYEFPLSSEAASANEMLQTLKRRSPALVPLPAPQLIASRARVYFEPERYREALADYQTLQRLVLTEREGSAPFSGPFLRLKIAECLFHLGRLKDAAAGFAKASPLTGEEEAEKMHYLAEMRRKRTRGSPAEFERQVVDLEERYPSSPWTEAALFSLGNYYLLRQDRMRASDLFEKIMRQFPNGRNRVEAHFRVAWGAYLKGENDRAQSLFKSFVERYPDSSRAVAALYWLGRLSETQAPPKAVAYYRTVVRDFGESRYAQSARERLAHLPEPIQATTRRETSIPDLKPRISMKDDPPTNPRAQESLQRAGLFERISLTDLAARELRAVLERSRSLEATIELAHIYALHQNFGAAMVTVRQAFPDYYHASMDQLPLNLWRVLFPLPYWSTIERYSIQKNVDPFLVASLIRQESVFNPLSKSHANALGLMQLLPREARRYARKERIARWSLKKIYDPEINIRLGVSYLAETLRRYNGSLEQVLAAYNAGDNRVAAWLKEYRARSGSASGEADPMEFIESIPFTETREYVQILLRNLSYYRKIYGTNGP